MRLGAPVAGSSPALAAILIVPVAQLESASVSDTEGRPFKSGQGYHYRIVRGSSSGRTRGSDPRSGGSNPPP